MSERETNPMGIRGRRRGDEPLQRRANGALEARVLAVLQEVDEALTAGEVAERLGEDLARTTVVTTLSRMHDKGVLTREARGRAFAYRPVADSYGLTARRMHQLLAGESNREAVLERFVDEMDAGDEQLLRRLLGSDLDPGQ
ncbi:BlaI/MecI/CopY family transcriptional regulator [Kitasatospora sp. NBC_01287]|uniref:BlaI/MecI/CopY family transcriptional regulator n=1 Tax=Kitasatospora sp. NBC_01287 TaxID=2903573 RepID=UPI0022508D15|nr:BlaI/MecI/CopY family transcriptional regulator [Kitasatospora sp. NBC_01287]MCX4749227.1 BlaI/MecI/CopY family transcriptional regulator [Kitasatospora sp. NBC_01287]